MSGHSKWANIRIRKGKQDAIRGKVFTRLAREIIIAARLGGGDPSSNARLRAAIDKAKSESLPKDNIERAIKKGTGEIEGENFEEITYEGIGPGGVAIMIDVYSENRNRTVGELRHTLTRNGGNLTENGLVSWQFKAVGQITVEQTATDEETLTLAALDAGAEDVVAEDGVFVVQTQVEDLHRCAEELVRQGIPTSDVALTRIPTNLASPSVQEMRQLVHLLDALEELDDVKETQINAEIPDDILQEA
ncbi:MAG TPA: YebC/PmpR family DNA-binding transcriptional regulator [Fimbriimonadaceae bacterium]|nr:YebC/PmpR family DNA-binding transcriptional regulator [Fimbriimonadaceae bacterium]